jgi:hypothetical protein
MRYPTAVLSPGSVLQLRQCTTSTSIRADEFLTCVRRRLRTRLTTLADRARLVVIQDGNNVYVEEAVPIKRPVRHGLGAVEFTDDHTPTARAKSCLRPICLMRLPLSAASCLGARIANTFVELVLVEPLGDNDGCLPGVYRVSTGCPRATCQPPGAPQLQCPAFPKRERR